MTDLQGEVIKADALAWQFLVHSLSADDNGTGPHVATGLRWPELPHEAVVRKELAQRVLFSKNCAERQTAGDLRGWLGSPHSGASVRALQNMSAQAFGAALRAVTQDHFAPKQARGHKATTYYVALRVRCNKSVIT